MQLSASLVVVVCAPLLMASCTDRASPDVELQGAVDKSSCTARPISVRAFVHVSRHGMWISKDPGINGEGMVILLKNADLSDDEVQMLISYGRDYSQQQAHAFKATFIGVTECTGPGNSERLSVEDIEQVSLIELRDAQEPID